MATIRAYTTIEQSRKLAEILPLESADMFYNEEPDETYRKDIVDTKYPMVIREGQKHYLEEYGIPCWSLTALLSVLCRAELEKDYATWDDSINLFYRVKVYKPDVYVTNWQDNPVDACYEMILKLHELNLL